MSTATAAAPANGVSANESAVHESAAGDILDQILLQTDLSNLDAPAKVSYYRQVCHSMDLNPLTKPFDYLWMKGQKGEDKLILYATKNCTDQLRKKDGITVKIIDRAQMDGFYVVTAQARTAEGREDESTGAVPTERENGQWKDGRNGKRYFDGDGTFSQIRGDALANAIMKAETKAKRRVTLSICGLSMIDESEIDSIPGVRRAGESEAPLTAQQQPGTDKPASAPSEFDVRRAGLKADLEKIAAYYKSTAADEQRQLWDHHKLGSKMCPDLTPEEWSAIEKTVSAELGKIPAPAAPNRYANSAPG